MALIEKFVVVANHFPVHAGEEIIEGMMVKLNAAGEVVLASGASGEICIGVAADTKSVQTSGLPGTNNAVIGAINGVTLAGTAQQFVNRVSDTFDETKASGRMTVYMNGGFFATNQFVGTPTVNAPLYVDATGVLSAVPSTSAQIVGYCTKAPGPYDSGVPGVDATGDMTSLSMSLGSYLEWKMII